jgi:putative transposase
MTERAYKYCFYPTTEQENLLRGTMGCVRLVYNKALAAKTEGWYERQNRIDYKQTSGMLTNWKKTEELDFLNEVSCVPLQQCLRHLQKAFANFWGKRAKYPRFKAKRNGGLESRGAIMPRPSLLDPYVQFSSHTAPDILSFRFCSCG